MHTSLGGQNSFIFTQFPSKHLQNDRLAHSLWKLVPPQENPGSATEYNVMYYQFLMLN